MNQSAKALTLSQLNARIGLALSVPSLSNVWVVAELSDLRINRGHAYVELIEKNSDDGTVNARLRAVAWANVYARISAEFIASTGQRLESGMKVMLCGSLTFHPAYGMSLVISAINPSFTLGEAEQRRREILQRLEKEGVLELNRTLPWPQVPSRIAIISAAGAAGYGDFINQLFNNQLHLRFTAQLFPAVMQGDRTVDSVISALDAIAYRQDEFDCVVIIRGGGATIELQSFDNYALANNIAQFPLPVIVGIGHERDTTVLDYVANMRVKTPTAAAEWLIERGARALEQITRLATDISLQAADIVSTAKTQLAWYESTLQSAPVASITRMKSSLERSTMQLVRISAQRITPETTRLQALASRIAAAAENTIQRSDDRLTAFARLLDALSPQATLRRGYTLTTAADGSIITSAASVAQGQCITTHFADGEISSTINHTPTQE